MYILRRAGPDITSHDTNTHAHRSLSIAISRRQPAHVRDSGSDRKHVTSTGGSKVPTLPGPPNDEASDVDGTTDKVGSVAQTAGVAMRTIHE